MDGEFRERGERYRFNTDNNKNGTDNCKSTASR
jgi:hypothetical protein